MPTRLLALSFAAFLLGGCATEWSLRTAPQPAAPAEAAPLTLPGGGTFIIQSTILDEPRRINVLWPSVYGEKVEGPLPVLYMLDGGLAEDFQHIAGLVQVLVSNGGMRPFLLVGIENTQRRRDMTGPTSVAEDRKIAPQVGGSAAFRRFIKDELKPAIAGRFYITTEAAIVGESLAGLFVVETFLREPDLFSTYIAIDPSLWWNAGGLVQTAGQRAADRPSPPKAIFLASSSEPDMTKRCAELAGTLSRVSQDERKGIVRYVAFPEESHATIYHPAALRAFREVLTPTPSPTSPTSPSHTAPVRHTVRE